MVTKATNKSTAGKGAAEAVSIFKTCKWRMRKHDRSEESALSMEEQPILVEPEQGTQVKPKDNGILGVSM